MGKKISDDDMSFDDNLDDELSLSDIDLDIEDSDSDAVEVGSIISKHTKEGKHSLGHDSIFKGKKNTRDEDIVDEMEDHFDNNFKIDVASAYYDETINNEEYVRGLKLAQRVRDVLANYTDINFMSNRRKPSEADFNKYFLIVKTILKDDGFSDVALFMTLAEYFSDNPVTMLRLLDNAYISSMVNDLIAEFGGKTNNKIVTNRNLHVQTEIRFKNYDEEGNLQIIDGIITETDYQTSTFKVDSKKNIYEVNISNIKEIISNDRYKFNLNMLNDIDFI